MKAICSLGDNISEGSEKLLQRGRGEGQDIGNFGEGEYMQSTTYFCRRFLVVTRNSHHHEEF